MKVLSEASLCEERRDLGERIYIGADHAQNHFVTTSFSEDVRCLQT